MGKFTSLALACSLLTGVALHAADQVEQPQETTKDETLAKETVLPTEKVEVKKEGRTSLFSDLNSYDIGTFSGHLKELSIYNDFGGDANIYPHGNGYAHTASLNLKYISKEYVGFKFGFEYIHGAPLSSGGGELDSGDTKGVNWLANGQINVLNQLFINYNLKALGLEKTNLTVGRQVLESTDGHWDGLSFIPKKNIRHKDQAIEGITMRFEDVDDLNLIIGHVEKFSNWGWTDYDGDMFDDVEDAFLRKFGQDYNGNSFEGLVNGNGMQFIEGTYSGISDLKLTAFDYYCDEVINTIGGKVAYQIAKTWKFDTQFVHQDGIGELKDVFNNLWGGDAEIRSDLFEASITKSVGNLNFQLGYLTVLGDNSDDTTYKSFTAPFEFNSGIAGQILVNTSSFTAGAKNYYINTTGTIGKTFIALLYTYTDHVNSALASKPMHAFDAQEIDLILSHPITDNLSVQFLTGMAYRNGKTGNEENGYATDIRAGLTYNF